MLTRTRLSTAPRVPIVSCDSSNEAVHTESVSTMVSRRFLHRRSEHRYCLSSRHYFFAPSILWLRPDVVYPDQSLVEADTQYRSSPSILANDCSFFLRKGMLTSGVLAAEVQQTCLMAILLFGKQLYGVSFNLFLMSSTCRDALVRCTRSARGRDAAKTGSTLHVSSSSFADVSSPCDDLSEPAP